MDDTQTNPFPMAEWTSSIVGLIRKTSTTLPDDVVRAIGTACEAQSEMPRARAVLSTISKNADLARKKSIPMCQDTGTLTFWLQVPVGADQLRIAEAIRAGVAKATELGYLRQNTILPLNGKSIPTNVADGCPVIHFEQVPEGGTARVSLLLKGGGCENMNSQYSLPDATLHAGRDLEGVRACILHAVWRAQGMGCAPGIIGVCIGGDRATGYEEAKKQLLRPLDEEADNQLVADFEHTILKEANTLGIGPMGLGGETTLLGVKITGATRLPASFFVTIAYSCWACRRHTVEIDLDTGVTRNEEEVLV